MAMTGSRVLVIAPRTIPVKAIPLPVRRPPLFSMSESPRQPRMIAGTPVKSMQTTEDKPSTRLAIALPLVPVGPPLMGTGPNSSPTTPAPGGPAMTNSLPQLGQRARRPAFSSFVWNCLPQPQVTRIGTGGVSERFRAGVGRDQGHTYELR